jgi:RNA polymerase sigma-70 factor (ECF subfamily)
VSAPDFVHQPSAPPDPAAGGSGRAPPRGEGAAPFPPDDAALVARVRMGDETAFETLYRAHHDRLWKFAYGYLRSREMAEEVVQDVFLSVWRERSEWDVRSTARVWLYAAVRNRALNHLRHERVVARLVDGDAGLSAAGAATEGRDEAPAMGQPPPDAQTRLETGELEETVARALAALPERRRLAMTLRWRHDFSAAEIARVLATTPESVRVLLTRARQDLAGLLARLRE